MTDKGPELIPIREAAKILGTHPSTLRSWDRAGKLRAVRVGSRGDRRFNRAEVLAAAQAGRPTDQTTEEKLRQLGNPISPIISAPIADLTSALSAATPGVQEMLAQYEAATPRIQEVLAQYEAATPRIQEVLAHYEAARPGIQEMLAHYEAVTRAAAEAVSPSRDFEKLVMQSLGDLSIRLSESIPSLGELLGPTMWEHRVLQERMAEYANTVLAAERFSSAVYARLATTQIDLSCTQAIASLAASISQVPLQVTEQIRANIGAFQDLSRAALWDLGDTVDLIDRRLPFAELKLAGGLLQSATALVTDFRTEPGDAPPAAARKPNLFQYFHRDAREIPRPDQLSDLQVETELKAVKSFRSGNAGLAIVEACTRANRTAQLRGQDLVFQPSVDTVAIAARLPLSFAGNETEFGDVVDGLYKLIFEASGDGGRLRALAQPSHSEALNDLVVLRHYYRHDLEQGKPGHDPKRTLRRVGGIFRRLTGKSYPSSPTDWGRACLGLLRLAHTLVATIADSFEGPGSTRDRPRR